MHICFAGAKSCPPRIGGIEVFVFELGKRLASKGAKVTVVVPRMRGQNEKDEIEGLSVRRIWAFQDRYFLKVSMIPQEFRIAGEIGPDIFHANDPPSGILSLLDSRWRSSVLTVHGIGLSPSEWSTPFRQGGTLLQRLALKGATAVVTTDNRTASLLTKYRKDILVIPPGVDTELFRKADQSRPSSLEDGKTNILFVGRLTKVKGIDLLLEGLSSMKAEMLERIKLTVIGNGPMASLIQESKTLSPYVNWVGELPYREIPPFLANADLLVMPSRSEGLPISMLEAMAASLPVVSTMAGGTSVYFDERHLTRIESLTPKGVADAIENAMNDKATTDRRARAARELVESQFSWDRVVDRYFQLYNETLN